MTLAIGPPKRLDAGGVSDFVSELVVRFSEVLLGSLNTGAEDRDVPASTDSLGTEATLETDGFTSPPEAPLTKALLGIPPNSLGMVEETLVKQLVLPVMLPKTLGVDVTTDPPLFVPSTFPPNILGTGETL